MGEMSLFHAMALRLSERTYQGRLLDAGLPDSPAFLHEMNALAAADSVRGFLLFHGNTPVAYLYAPIRDEAMIYGYLGYDPDYADFSVGHVLQHHVMRYLFDNPGLARWFDFTEGEGAHKRLWSTDAIPCATIFYLSYTPRHLLGAASHAALNYSTSLLSDTLARHDVKAQVKRWARNILLTKRSKS
ncbi:hypothetical protein MAIT1_01508 [Magnetofaba australis IT-1]|uniref:BioF2-like acetyltransferase domain-containing protein n=1 Tax=Magnetofaba australis IT-1 TaxID=1434232 RepID=A0A1Y2K0G6_9PROT|nr:hypothetical protein MAIT1_01508 [Magnetofaba australis IT-1]